MRSNRYSQEHPLRQRAVSILEKLRHTSCISEEAEPTWTSRHLTKVLWFDLLNLIENHITNSSVKRQTLNAIVVHVHEQPSWRYDHSPERREFPSSLHHGSADFLPGPRLQTADETQEKKWTLEIEGEIGTKSDIGDGSTWLCRLGRRTESGWLWHGGTRRRRILMALTRRETPEKDLDSHGSTGLAGKGSWSTNTCRSVVVLIATERLNCLRDSEDPSELQEWTPSRSFTRSRERNVV